MGDDEATLYTDETTYSGSWPETVTRGEVARELRLHGVSMADFEADFAVQGQGVYRSADVLGWLGY